ncbi:carbon storage regulator CsrA [Thalassobacillus pellis]|uniref:carbon storage regulator CsrA n=1 Tax=Thalassobacillus pellis TaxID=748008 RepID=UPI00195F981B|nr:carbon storage regulator CsrA [Thalassobacillus pellis]MBM7551430.1 carbon storage regulator [Thalassobacillus pellis]
MLVLNRKVNESLKIGDDIEVKVIAVDGDQVKIGISAPKNVDIYRQEIYQKIIAENEDAMKTPDEWMDLLKSQ